MSSSQPHLVQRLPPVAHGDHEVAVDEQQDLADLDDSSVVDVAHGLQHHEQRVAVHLELRPLVRVDRVLDRERMQVELLANGVELLLGRLEQPDPHEGAIAPAGKGGLLDRGLARMAPAVLVDGAVDDHRKQYAAHIGSRSGAFRTVQP